MGLDWIVLSKTVDGKEILPTDVLGARRASRSDPAAVAALTDHWNKNPHLRAGKKDEDKWTRRMIGILNFFGVRAQLVESPDADFRGQTLEEYITYCVDKEVPPIVVPFGDGCDDAIPAVEASSQYYGFRAQALVDERNNPLAAFAKEKNVSLDWAYEKISGESQFQQAIDRLTQVLELYTSAYPEIAAIAIEGGDKQDPEYDDTPDQWEEAIESFTIFQGAIRWLKFWRDKGFEVAADY